MRRLMIGTMLLVLAVAAQATAEKKKNPDQGKIKVWVFTQTGDKDGFTDSNTKQRVDAVKLMKRYVDGKWLTTVESESPADFTLEIVDSPRFVGGTAVTTSDPYTVRAVLKVGDHIEDFQGETGTAKCLYGYCFGEIALGVIKDKVEDWVRENYDTIVARRRGSEPIPGDPAFVGPVLPTQR